MSDTLTNNPAAEHSKGLSREKMRQLLAAVGSRPTDETTQIESTEYDWHQPHCFNSAQLERLDDFTNTAAAVMAQKFADFYHNDFNVTITSTTQHFAGEYQSSTAEQDDYYLSFSGDRQQPCGFVGIPPQTAFIWATQLLGGSEPDSESKEGKEGSDRKLSQLEESLLIDIASNLVEAFSGACETCDFHPATEIVTGRLPLELTGDEDLCKIGFKVKKAGEDADYEAYFLMLCDNLQTVVGKIAQADNEFSTGDISKAIRSHLEEMPVSVTAKLASAQITFEQIASLQTDDILLLDSKVEEPVELIVEGRRFFKGRPVKSAGKYAVVITELSINGG